MLCVKRAMSVLLSVGVLLGMVRIPALATEDGQQEDAQVVYEGSNVETESEPAAVSETPFISESEEDSSAEETDGVIASGTWEDNESLSWKLDESYTLTISGSGDMPEVECYGDTPWYSYRTSIQVVVLEAGVTSVSDYAFYNCTSLTSVSIADSVTAIGAYAFGRCTALAEIVIPDSVTSLGEGLFFYCTKLTDVSVGGGVIAIGDGAFNYCNSLETIQLPSAVAFVGEQAFFHCVALTAINVAEGNDTFCSLKGVLYSKDMTTVVCCPAGVDSYDFPDGVTVIGDSAFEGCANLTEIAIPETVTTIGESAFAQCTGLTEIVIPDSVKLIGENAFYSCTSLTVADVSSNVTVLESYLFYQCSALEKVTIGANVTSIGSYAFAGCSSLTGVELPDTLTKIGMSAFRGCGLTAIVIPDSVTSIGNSAFYNCTALETVTLGNGCAAIDSYLFQNCSAMTAITIPNSVSAVGGYAFSGCDSLTDVYFGGTVSQWGDVSVGTGNDCLTTAAIHYGTLEAPSVSLSVTAGSDGKLVLTGTFEDYANADGYYTVTAHGLVYYSTTKLGNRTLTVNTSGRTRVNFSKYTTDGSFTYNMTPANGNTKYTVRAFLAYTDANGKTVYVYSDPIAATYNGLN
ncbi:MAG: leucine-rich repeat domain-containing protein [Clostridiales bacterium]|nr:leucine-rich repeat domain-containing protein [Clostridiales bacterium]